VTEVLTTRGYRVVIGEADSGGYNRFPMEAVFENTGLNAMAAELGARLVNLSLLEPERIVFRCRGRRLKVPVPKLLLHEIDAFISLPVPKVHLNTRVSFSIKNQWGCIQEPSERLRLHPFFAEVMFELNRRLPKAHAIVDGRFGLNRSGPMLGDPVELNWLLVSNDLVAADRTCCRLIGVEESSVRHLSHFRREGWWTPWNEVSLSQPWEPFHRVDFHLRRKWTDLPGLACFHSPFLAWLGYHSPLAGFAHWLLNLFREPLDDYDQEKTKLEDRNQNHGSGRR
jgi:uncharacterized protein (DUF362 family)